VGAVAGCLPELVCSALTSMVGNAILSWAVALWPNAAAKLSAGQLHFGSAGRHERKN
jgi:hypothetical protein